MEDINSSGKVESVLYSDKIGYFFFEGAIRALIAMFVCIATMWLVSIFTILISMNVIIVVSAGVGVAFGAMRIFDLTMEKMKK
ncbi:Uncharacterised protein [Candidatus Tiddalikarchaeum anstoanum]|nr:Uncharacterised protein [Candidatus Tiddalikarchaeum anstoanum]